MKSNIKYFIYAGIVVLQQALLHEGRDLLTDKDLIMWRDRTVNIPLVELKRFIEEGVPEFNQDNTMEEYRCRALAVTTFLTRKMAELFHEGYNKLAINQEAQQLKLKCDDMINVDDLHTALLKIYHRMPTEDHDSFVIGNHKPGRANIMLYITEQLATDPQKGLIDGRELTAALTANEKLVRDRHEDEIANATAFDRDRIKPYRRPTAEMLLPACVKEITNKWKEKRPKTQPIQEAITEDNKWNRKTRNQDRNRTSKDRDKERPTKAHLATITTSEREMDEDRSQSTKASTTSLQDQLERLEKKTKIQEEKLALTNK